MGNVFVGQVCEKRDVGGAVPYKVCDAKFGLMTNRSSGNKINLPAGSAHAN